MIVVFIAIGALPFVVGGMQNWYMLNNADTLLPYSLISLFFLFIWGCIAFLLNGRRQQTKIVVVFLNLIALLDLLLVGIQELILQHYWTSIVGTWSQYFYLPLLNLGFRLTNWSHIVFPAYAASFLLMLGVSFIGCKLREKAKR